MSFQSMMSGAECSTGNSALSSFLKHTSGDRSLQQGDRTMAGSSAGASTGMRRQMPAAGGPAGQEAEQWFRQQQQMGGAPINGDAAFQFEAMRAEMERMGGPGAGDGWAAEMQKRGGGPGGPSPADMEQYFKNIQQQHQARGNPADFEAAFMRGGNDGGQAHAWSAQFGSQAPGGGGATSAQANAMPTSRPMMMGGGGYSSMMMGGGGGMYGASRMSGGMYSRPMASSEAQQADAKGKGRFVELDDAKWEEQFQKLDAAHAAADQAEALDKGKGKQREGGETSEVPTQAEMDAKVRAALDELESDVTLEGREAEAKFEELWQAMNAIRKHAPAKTSGIPGATTDSDLLRFEEELTKARQANGEESDGEYELGGLHPSGGLVGGGRSGLFETAGWDGTEDALLDGFGTIGDDGFPRLGTYRFNQQNPFAQHPNPLAEGLRLLSSGGSLADAALLFEAATQRNAEGGSGGEQGEVDRARREKSEAWRRLGEAQAMNERESQAIRALEEAIKIDDGNLEAHMALAISYTNEGYDAAAHATLERYIAKAYPHIKAGPDSSELDAAVYNLEGRTAPQGPNPWASLNRVTNMFLQAAREGASRGAIDPEIQVGLGVLFYSNSSYDQAKDCFETALQARPNDFLLWNRLGATLANGGNPEQAIEAYHKALELRPTFTRAIYNLSVSCLNLGAHHEAAEHLLAALALQATTALPDTPDGAASAAPLAEAQESHNLWSTLRRIFLSMDRMDLAQHAHVGADLSQFRKEGFEF